MGSSRKLKRVSLPILSVEEMDRIVKEMGAEYRGPRVEEDGVKFTKYQLMVYDCIRKNPGIWRNELERLIGPGAEAAVYKLIRAGLVIFRNEDGKKRFYVVGDENGVET